MFSLVNEWGWGIDEIGDLDDFESWDYNRIIQFWNNIKVYASVLSEDFKRIAYS